MVLILAADDFRGGAQISCNKFSFRRMGIQIIV